MVKVFLVLAALIGSAVCEPPGGFGLDLNLGLGGHGGHGGDYSSGGYAAAPVGGYDGHGHGHGHGLTVVNHAPRFIVAPIHVNPAPAMLYGPPSGLNFGASFGTDFGFGGGHHQHHDGGHGHGGYAAAPVVKKPVVSVHNYDYAPFKPILAAKPVYKAPVYEAPLYKAPVYDAPAYKAPVYDAPAYKAPVYDAPVYKAPVYKAAAPVYGAPHHEHSEFSITPSISYGYSYKLVPTNSFGPVHGHHDDHHHHHDHHHVAKAPVVKAPVLDHGHGGGGSGASFGLDLGFGLGHGGHHH